MTLLSGMAAKNLSNKTNATISDFYRLDDQIDTVFIGPSLLYYGINPYYIDLITGENTFVLATQSQRIDMSCYMVKEVIRTKNVNRIVLDTYSFTLDGKTPVDSALSLFYNLPFSKIKIDMYKENDFVTLQDLIFPLIDTHSYIYEKTDESTLNKMYYKGYWGRYKTMSDAEQISQNIATGEISEQSQKKIKEIIDLCNDNNIELVFISTPLIEHKTNENVVEAESKINNYLEKELGMTVHNYNLEVQELGLTTKHYYDPRHLNFLGSYIFSIKLAEDLGGDLSRLEQIDDFRLVSLKNRGWYQLLLVDEQYGKGYQVTKSPINTAPNDAQMFCVDLMDDVHTQKGEYEFSIVLGFDKNIDKGILEKFVCTNEPENIIDRNVTKLSNGYYRVNIITTLDPQKININRYFYLSKSIEHNINIKVFSAQLKLR